MKLIIGGAFQGKRTYAMEAFGLTELDIFPCTGMEVDFTAPCIDDLEEFCLACVRSGVEPRDIVEANKAKWENTVFICQDIFCGVVPMDAELREWRQATGRLCQYLTREAEQVSRIFCGLEQRLK